jgi:hypothetical protein
LGVGLRLEDGRQLSWGGILHRSTMRVVSEAAFVQNKTIFAVSNVEVQT